MQGIVTSYFTYKQTKPRGSWSVPGHPTESGPDPKFLPSLPQGPPPPPQLHCHLNSLALSVSFEKCQATPHYKGKCSWGGKKKTLSHLLEDTSTTIAFSLGITVTYNVKSFRALFLETLLNFSASFINFSAWSYHFHILYEKQEVLEPTRKLLFSYLWGSWHKERKGLKAEWHPTPVLLPGKFHGQRSLGGCSPLGRWGSDMTERLHFHFSLSCTGEGNGNPLQCSCLENPRDRGAWWAAVYGVTQSRTRLKWLSIPNRCRTCEQKGQLVWPEWTTGRPGQFPWKLTGQSNYFICWSEAVYLVVKHFIAVLWCLRAIFEVEQMI